MKHFGEYEITRSAALSDGVRDLSVHCPGVAPSARAGQFAHIATGLGEALLPRPVSICEIGRDSLRFVFRVQGAGTAAIAARKPGESLRMAVPLGNGFRLSTSRRVAVIGGGIGAPPMLALTHALKREAPDRPVHAFLGFTGDPFLTRDFEHAGATVHLSTNDGRAGFHGLITDHIDQTAIPFDAWYACGPRPMLEALAAMAAARGIRLFVSLEERMACGVGACVGCVVRVEIPGGFAYEKVCADGPVFDARRVVWD